MITNWTLAAQSAACGLIGLVLVVLIRWLKKIKPVITPLNALTTYLGFALAPSIPVLLSFPFVEPKPDLADHSVFLVLAALALVWAIYEALRQGLK